jgi:hypothetical protein
MGPFPHGSTRIERMTLSPATLAKIKEHGTAVIELTHRIASEAPLEDWHKILLVKLASAMVKASYHVSKAPSLEPPLEVHLNCIAWATRCAYEARLCIRFCALPEDAKLFLADVVNDTEAVLDGFMAFGKMMPADILAQMKFERSKLGVTHALAEDEVGFKVRKVRISDLAVGPDLKLEHTGMYTVLSKLTHVSALSVMWPPEEPALIGVINALALYVAACLADTQRALRELLPKDSN